MFDSKPNNLQKISDDPFAYRGYLISVFAELEQYMDICLARQFVPDGDFEEIIAILIDRLNFEAKRTALKALLDKKCTLDGFKKTKNNKFPHSAILDEIRQLSEIRNYFAHYYLCDFFSPGSVIELVEYRNSTTVIKYSKKEFEVIIERIVTVMHFVNDTIGTLKST